jgi:hypothetical protein
LAREAPVALPARAGRFGGLRPPAEEVTYSLRSVSWTPPKTDPGAAVRIVIP